MINNNNYITNINNNSGSINYENGNTKTISFLKNKIMKIRTFIFILIVLQIVVLFINFDLDVIALILWEICYIVQNKVIEDKDRKIDLLEREKINLLTKIKK